MNMRKVGTFIQSKSRLAAEAETAEKSLKSMAHAIHYANKRNGQGGAIQGLIPRRVWNTCHSSQPYSLIDTCRFTTSGNHGFVRRKMVSHCHASRTFTNASLVRLAGASIHANRRAECPCSLIADLISNIEQLLLLLTTSKRRSNQIKLDCPDARKLDCPIKYVHAIPINANNVIN